MVGLRLGTAGVTPSSHDASIYERPYSRNGRFDLIRQKGRTMPSPEFTMPRGIMLVLAAALTIAAVNLVFA